MKFTLFLFALFFVGILSAQPNQNVTQNSGGSMLRAANGIQSSYGSSTLFYNPKRKIIGSEYLFDNWNYSAIIYTKNNQNFLVKDVNLNINRNSFSAKFAGDSLFTFNFNNIEKILINDREFKNVYTSDGKRIYEVVHESKDFSILKGFKVELVSGSPNPMVNRANDKFVRRESYFVLKNNSVNLFKLKKNKILKLLEKDQQKVVTFEKYMSDYNLSYKKERDVKKALDYVSIN